MPVSETPENTSTFFTGFSVLHVNGVQFKIETNAIGGYTTEQSEEAFQSIMDYLNVWPDRDEAYAIQASMTDSQNYAFTPTPPEE